MKEFFARWVYGTDHPRYELSWEWKADTKKVRLVLRQLQTEPVFRNALPIDILTNSGKLGVVLKPTGKAAERVVAEAWTAEDRRQAPRLTTSMVLKSQETAAARQACQE